MVGRWGRTCEGRFIGKPLVDERDRIENAYIDDDVVVARMVSPKVARLLFQSRPPGGLNNVATTGPGGRPSSAKGGKWEENKKKNGTRGVERVKLVGQFGGLGRSGGGGGVGHEGRGGRRMTTPHDKKNLPGKSSSLSGGECPGARSKLVKASLSIIGSCFFAACIGVDDRTAASVDKFR